MQPEQSAEGKEGLFREWSACEIFKGNILWEHGVPRLE